MGLPDSREVEPTSRENAIEGFNNEPVFVANFEENEIMQVDGDDSDDNNGYLRLRMHETEEEMPADDTDSSGSDDEEENEFGSFNNMEEEVVEQPPGIPSIISADSELEAQVWNNSNRAEDTI